MSNEILFLSHRMPFPPDRGDKIRSHHILKRLCGIAPVHVATFAEDENDIAEEVELAAITRSYRLVRRVKPLIVAGLQALATREPVSVQAFASDELRDYVEAVLRERPIATIYAFSGQMGQYIPDWFEGRVIFDFVDVDSAKFEAYAERGWGPRRWIDAREARLLRAEEARLAHRAEVSLLVSRAEAALFRARLPAELAATCDVRALGNGIDSRLFDAAQVTPDPRIVECAGPRLIFTGQMDYAPNVAGVQRAARSVLPLIRRELAQASFHIVGRNPPDEVLALREIDGVHVWGGVPDIRSALAAADLALVPLDIARGIQNKVLEAMAMSLPVVLSPEAATGIDAVDGEHFAIGRDDPDLAGHAVALLENLRLGWNMGAAARKFAVENLSWPAQLAILPELLGRAGPTHDAA